MESRWGGRSRRLCCLPPSPASGGGRRPAPQLADLSVPSLPSVPRAPCLRLRGSPLQPVRLQPTRPQGGLVSRALKLMTFAESRECDLGVAFWGHRHPVTHRRAGMSLGHQRLPLLRRGWCLPSLQCLALSRASVSVLRMSDPSRCQCCPSKASPSPAPPAPGSQPSLGACAGSDVEPLLTSAASVQGQSSWGAPGSRGTGQWSRWGRFSALSPDPSRAT